MRIEKLQLRHFRNYESQELEFTDGINVFIGENAQGKTNALEAISFLALGKSHRTHKDQEMIQWNQDHAVIEGQVLAQNRMQRMRMEFLKNGKKAQINGVHVTKMTDFIGRFQVVLFAPEDLLLVKGSPGQRRRFIDMELGQTKPKYLYHLGQYGRIVQQRNTLLKQHNADLSYLAVFDDQFVEHAVPILLERFRFVEEMKRLAKDIYDTIADRRETFELRYVCSIPGFKGDYFPGIEATSLSGHLHDQHARQQLSQQLGDMIRSGLEQKRRQDQQIGYTTIGPHRDDLTFFLNGQSVHSFASQGQQRTIALALRLAEIEFIRKESGEYPVLLLDDVLSELDDRRQTNLLLSMSEKVQTVITTTSLFHLSEKLGEGTRLFYVRSGIIQKEG
ncbi:MAG: hypothetical protein A2201_12265 [Alicyclobacillus sp. RIFOXYA1_FULL_53_8]|nr:MAG: hypothetical protein A2201_12265 [Alicyclobacillus sp. RIFOXYA1_FULL_53_8]